MTHFFDTDLATEYGLLEAILINNFQYWLSHNKANNINFHDGHYWTFNTRKGVQELFPYVSDKQVRTALEHLVNESILMTGNYNSTPMDRTLWYAFADEDKWLKTPICPTRQMQMPYRANPFAPQGTAIPNNITNNITTTSKSAHTHEGLEKLKEWVKTSDLDFWIKKQLDQYKITEDIETLIQTFYEDDFTVREDINSNQRREVLKHFQYWLPKYLKTKTETNNEQSTKHDTRSQYERTMQEVAIGMALASQAMQ